MQRRLLEILIACVLSASAGSTLTRGVAHAADSTESASIDFDDLLINGTSKYAQKQQEQIIRHFFRDRPNGFYVDIGCYLPRIASTTFYLENELGWHGIAVDAEESYRDAWKQVRPRSKFFAYAVTDKSGETVTFYAAGAIASLEKRNIEFWEQAKQIEIDEKEVIVPTITIDDLLDREGVEKIDFLSIDINGTEPAAMSGFDIQRFRPDLVHIEVHQRNRKVLARYFEHNGYRRIEEYLEHDPSNWYFTPKQPATAPKGGTQAK